MNKPLGGLRKAGLLTFATIGLAGIPVVAGAKPPKPPKPPGNNALKFSAGSPIVDFGRSSVLSGQLTGSANSGLPVTLQQDVFPYGDGVQLVARATTDAHGRFTFTRAPGRNTNFRVTVKGRTATVGVRVRPRVSLRISDSTPAKGQLTTFSGKVRPAHDGAQVLLQRQTPTGSFAIQRRLVLQPAPGNESPFRTSLPVRSSGTYRIVILAHGDHLLGRSGLRLVTTH